MSSSDEPLTIETAPAELLNKLESLQPTRRGRVLRKLISASLDSIPWVGSFLAAGAAYKEESGQLDSNALFKEWLAQHQKKFERLGLDLAEIVRRLDNIGEDLFDRMESEEYLSLVRKAFKVYDAADTDAKRRHICNLLGNSVATAFTSDAVIRLFIDWIEMYDETHFAVMREIYRRPLCTRWEIWNNIHGQFPADNSWEADLYRMLISDLSIGRIIRQERATTSDGQFLKKEKQHVPKGSGSRVMTSAFDREDRYELSELGKQFVRYIFTEVMPRVEAGPSGN